MDNQRLQLELKVESSDVRRLIAEPTIERLATGFQFIEGPAWVEAGGYLIFSDIPANTMYRWDEQQGIAIFRQPSGFTNGNTLDREGRLLSCEHGNRRVSRTAADGSVTTVASHYDGKRLNSPNDIVVKSDGTIYFTDPPYGLVPDLGNTIKQETPWQGVYRVNPDGSGLTLLSDEFRAPNGLAFSPDERRLYIDDSEDMLLRVFDVLPDGSLGAGKILLTGMGSHASRRGVPDGMRVDAEGRVWMTGPDGIWILTPDGEALGVLPTPEVAANLTWGGPDRHTLYITGSTSLYRVRLTVTGAPVL